MVEMRQDTQRTACFLGREIPQEILDIIKQRCYYGGDGTIRAHKVPHSPTKEGDSLGYKDAHGYIVIGMTIRGKQWQFKRSHIVWYLCKGFWPRPTIDHKNRNTQDDRIDNLRVATAKEQAQNHDYSNNVGVSGEASGQSRFTEVQVLEMRSMRQAGWNYSAIARKFDTSPQAIRYCINIGWRHI